MNFIDAYNNTLNSLSQNLEAAQAFASVQGHLSYLVDLPTMELFREQQEILELLNASDNAVLNMVGNFETIANLFNNQIFVRELSHLNELANSMQGLTDWISEYKDCVASGITMRNEIEVSEALYNKYKKTLEDLPEEVIEENTLPAPESIKETKLTIDRVLAIITLLLTIFALISDSQDTEIQQDQKKQELILIDERNQLAKEEAQTQEESNQIAIQQNIILENINDTIYQLVVGLNETTEGLDILIDKSDDTTPDQPDPNTE